jgi:Phosphodiesterase/alkaline phosphatase D
MKNSMRLARHFTASFILFFLVASALHAQSSLLQSGPMLGYSEMREVLLWVQTKAPAKVQFRYWDKENPKQVFETETVQTSKEKAFTASLIADKVLPGRKYQYELYINAKKVDRPYPLEFQTQALWKYRTDPPDFTIAAGSCTYINEPEFDRPGKPYGQGYEIFKAIHEKRPDAMIWLGDNIYLREADWNSRTGIYQRYQHTRSLPELQPLLASVHHYAIWDDHDFGPNDCDGSFWNKEQALEAFKCFWGNPSYGVGNLRGICTQFSWGDADFFLLDNRYHRTPQARKTGPKTILGKEQFEWLINALAASKATFKVIAIGGQVLNPLAVYETYANYAEERQLLIDTITKEAIPGVIFISGDRHFTELTMMPRKDSYPLYELTCSPLTSGIFTGARKEANTLRVEGTLVEEQNFALMKFSGKREERMLTIAIYNKEGKELWSRSIKASDLQVPVQKVE